MRTLTGAEHADMLAIRDFLLTCLTEASKARSDNWEMVDTPRGLEPRWVPAERLVMLDMVNRTRADRGLAPVDIEEVCRVEHLAVGHVDYADKYALYCAEIAIGLKD